MPRLLVKLLLVLYCTLTFVLPSQARADVMPSDRKYVKYTLTITNLADFKDHVFFVYPTTNSGFAYRLEPGKGLTGLMMTEGWKGPATALYVTDKALLDKERPNPQAYAHGDGGATVSVFSPPSRSLVSAAPIHPPPLVDRSSPVDRIEKVFKIVRITDTAFEMMQTSEITFTSDGKQTVKQMSQTYASGAVTSYPGRIAPAAVTGAPVAGTSSEPSSRAAAAPTTAPTGTTPPTPPVTPPGGCAGCATGAGGAQGAWLALLAPWICRRLRGASRPPGGMRSRSAC